MIKEETNTHRRIQHTKGEQSKKKGREKAEKKYFMGNYEKRNSVKNT